MSKILFMKKITKARFILKVDKLHQLEIINPNTFVDLQVLKVKLHLEEEFKKLSNLKCHLNNNYKFKKKILHKTLITIIKFQKQIGSSQKS